jgi:hypothetical protein
MNTKRNRVMASYTNIDASRFPLVTIIFTGVPSTDENFEQYLTEMKALYDSGEKLAIIFDASNAALPSLKHQQRQASWLKKNDEMLKKQCLGTAYVITSGAIRVVLRMIFAITPQPVLHKICSNIDDAEEWALAQISA